MRSRLTILLVLVGLTAFAVHRVTVVRAEQAAAPSAQPSEVLALSGSDPGIFTNSDGPGGSDDYRISSLSVFSNVALHVKDNYVEPSRIDPKAMLVAALEEVERQVAEVWVEEAGPGKVKISVPGQQKIITVDDVESLWEINLKLREVFRFFEKHLPPQKDMRAVEYAAVNGALSTLDPHSVLLKPEAFADMKTSTKGEFGGLGIVISVRDGKLTVMNPLDNTPATRAGLRSYDVITRIGDVSTVSMPIDEAVGKLRGPVGSKVTIWVQRKSWPEARKFVLTREIIKIESVESRLLEDRVGYVRIKNFQQNTGRDLDDHLDKLSKAASKSGGLRGVVLDLRNNPGGLLDQAIRVSDKFLATGDIVTTVGYGNKLREPKRAQWSGTDMELPLVVLVNNGSASASEIVAGALKNLDRAVVVGERSFGKGSVQVLYDFADNSALKLTIAQYLTPGGISIQNVGVTPDLALKPAVLAKDGVRLYYEPDQHREASLDKHLDRAKSDEEVEAKPAQELTYLYEVDEKDEAAPAAEEDEGDEEAPPDTFREDYPIKLARQALVTAGKPKRSEMLAAMESLIATRRTDEARRVTEAITKLGMDWTPASATPSPKAAVTAELKLVGANAAGRIAAGTEVSIEARVTNVGDTPVAQLHGRLDTDHPAFRGRELLFGTLAPGASSTWSITARIPKEAASRSDIITLALASHDVALDSTAKLPVITEYVPHPMFAYSWSLDDSERGDGDGVLEKDEGVDLVVYVTNVGPGAADKVSLRLKSAAGEDLFLERGRAEIGAIAPGETRVGKLGFNVRAQQSVEGGKLPLELTIHDPSTGEWLEDELAVIAEPPSAAKLVKRKAQPVVATQETPVWSAAREGAPTLGFLPKGAGVSVVAKLDQRLKVELPEGGVAWVREGDVRPGKPAKKLPTDFVPARRPASIELEGEVGGRTVDTDTIVLSGQVVGRSVRDLYILSNYEKVYYASGPAPAASTGPRPREDAVRLPFSKQLALKEGLNKIVLVARVDERVITYRTLFVSRLPAAAGPAVAEAAAPSPSAKSLARP